ncbi:hypothetical protein K491DRAFT_719512 [Lophiostoma macrostomum CBS 122681]|uniref:CENP-V/GFA domain-containing protein n=1 Tax=Lophiostoma macrostomum CBS 122681 TaxID=1314788 RepID=A0A6A6SXQ4_9PLEO|nr:hypothetical protein K491DRAFT_719512 [Lophiostoma macrostomum CBS 122681]
MAAAENFELLTGHCTCKTITYSLLAPPLVTNCCHCTWCQRETGSAFVINCCIESSNFKITSDTSPTLVELPSESGKGQLVARCPNCFVALYSHYPSTERWTTYVRAGTLAEGSRQKISPEVHVFAPNKVQWLDLSGEKERGVPLYDEFYQKEDVWREASLERWQLLTKRRQAETSTE